MKIKYLALVFIFLVACNSNLKPKEKITIGIAANTQFVLEELIAIFEKENPTISIHSIVSSTGKLVVQIEQGAPIDILIAADTVYPNFLEKKGLVLESTIYTYGILTLWTRDSTFSFGNGTKIALADPKTAPYGRLAMQYLEEQVDFESNKSKLVYGESIAQVNHYIHAGVVDAALTCQATFYHPKFKNKGKYQPMKNYKIPQGIVLSQKAKNKAAASLFYQFILSTQAAQIFQKNGYQTN